MSLGHVVAVTIDSVIGGALLVLPGAGIRKILKIESRPGFDEIAIVIATSLIVTTVIGMVLLGIGQFRPGLIGLILAALSVPGISRVAVWLRRRHHGFEVPAFAILTVPWFLSTLDSGASPSHLFQWYYWDLGRVLGQVGTIPTFVTEYGTKIRWLPDYLAFNIASEAYRGLTGFGGATNAIVAFRVPIAALGIISIYAVMTLWFPRWICIVGTALSVSTVWFVTKFNGYKPESLGVVVGLLAFYLLIRGLRLRDQRLVVFVGVTLGLDLAVHAIAATVVGLLLAGAVIAELIRMSRTDRRRSIAAVGLTLLVALAVSGGLGWALQGRAWPLGDASHPTRSSDGSDPTLQFIRRDSGMFGAVEAPSIGDELSRSIATPWPEVDLDHPWVVIAGIIVTLGLIRAATRRNGIRTAAIALLMMSVLVTLAVCWFGFRYDTYVPRHTGLGRFTQYEPLLLVFGAVLALAALVPEPRDRPTRRARRRYALVRKVGAGICVAASLGFSVSTVQRASADQPTLPPAAIRMLDYLNDHADPGEVVLANISTRGLLEFWTGTEAPIESRQALLETPEFGATATKLLEDANRFFSATGSQTLADELRANWVLVADGPSALGGSVSLGQPPAGWTPAGFTLAKSEPHLALFRRESPFRPVETVGRGESRGGRVVIVLLVPAALACLALVLNRRRASTKARTRPRATARSRAEQRT